MEDQYHPKMNYLKILESVEYRVKVHFSIHLIIQSTALSLPHNQPLVLASLQVDRHLSRASLGHLALEVLLVILAHLSD